MLQINILALLYDLCHEVLNSVACGIPLSCLVQQQSLLSFFLARLPHVTKVTMRVRFLCSRTCKMLRCEQGRRQHTWSSFLISSRRYWNAARCIDFFLLRSSSVVSALRFAFTCWTMDSLYFEEIEKYSIAHQQFALCWCINVSTTTGYQRVQISTETSTNVIHNRYSLQLHINMFIGHDQVSKRALLT